MQCLSSILDFPNRNATYNFPPQNAKKVTLESISARIQMPMVFLHWFLINMGSLRRCQGWRQYQYYCDVNKDAHACWHNQTPTIYRCMKGRGSIAIPLVKRLEHEQRPCSYWNPLFQTVTGLSQSRLAWEQSRSCVVQLDLPSQLLHTDGEPSSSRLPFLSIIFVICPIQICKIMSLFSIPDLRAWNRKCLRCNLLFWRLACNYIIVW